MTDFSKFSRAVETRLAQLAKHELYVVAADKDAVWAHYLASFPEGTDPIFRTRTEHDCSCCKNFLRNMGIVVAIIDGEVETVWAVKDVGHPYDAVAEAMDAYVKALPIRAVFRTKERSFGNGTTRELLDIGSTRTWHHFVGKVEPRHHSRDADAERGRFDSVAGVLKRGLEELTAPAIETVLDLINSNALYRGQEFKASVVEFQKLRRAYWTSNHKKDVFVWQNVGHPAARFKNTVIGTLVQDLSEGMDLEAAVRSFEQKVAPQNYKRPTALITPRMVQDAMKTVTDLGLEPALKRRFARLSDVSVNNVLWVDNGVKPLMKDGIEGLLLDAVAPVKPNIDRAEPIGIDAFLKDVLPRATAMDVLVENKMLTNFVSLTAPEVAGDFALLKWSNGFAWSYDGNVADSIKERVKRAGGDVDAALRVSLAWFNTDDLDLHVHEPNGNHIYFGNKGGKLDVDMNVSSPVRDAVENVRWKGKPPSGTYRVEVNNYNQRESKDVGFTIEMESEGVVRTFTHERAVRGMVPVMSFTVDKNGRVVNVEAAPGIKSGTSSQEKWGIATGNLVKVNTLLLSPNHWDDNATGNKHWFFILDGCKNPEPTRGIYNEYLNPALEKHRKVFEILGDKTKCPVADEQLSGLGFSSTRHDTATVLVKGPRLQKAYTITF